MNINFSLSQITPQLSVERLKGYKWLLTGQVIIAIIFLFVYELFNRYPFANWQSVLLGVVGILMMGMNYLTYELIKDFTENKLIQNTVLFLLWGGVLLSFITASGVIEKETLLYILLSSCSILLSLMSFIILLQFMITDIFKEKHDIIYRLWGSASIYMLIGASFGLFFTLLEIILPNEFLLDATFDIFHFIPCYNFSFYNLAGIDSPYVNFSLLVKNIAVIESIFSNLYIVLVVGRLLSK